MLKSSWQHPWNHGRYLCQTWWKDGCDKDGGWKGGGWLRSILYMTLMLCGGRSIRIGAGIFHNGDLSGVFCGVGVERWDWQLVLGIVLVDFVCWVLVVDSLCRWLNLGYCYSHTFISCISPIYGLPLSICNDDIKYEHAHNSHTGGGYRACKVTT